LAGHGGNGHDWAPSIAAYASRGHEQAVLAEPAGGRQVGARVCGRTTRPWPGLLPALLVQTATHDEPTRSPALTQAAYAMTAYMRHESGGPMLYT
jgi:hypothetical protein